MTEEEAEKEYGQAFTNVYLLGLQNSKEAYAKEQVIKELESITGKSDKANRSYYYLDEIGEKAINRLKELKQK